MYIYREIALYLPRIPVLFAGRSGVQLFTESFVRDNRRIFRVASQIPYSFIQKKKNDLVCSRSSIHIWILSTCRDQFCPKHNTCVTKKVCITHTWESPAQRSRWFQAYGTGCAESQSGNMKKHSEIVESSPWCVMTLDKICGDQ